MSFTDYEILGPHSGTGSCHGYRARQRSTGRLVVVEVYGEGRHTPDYDLWEMALERVEAAALLDHPNILPVLEVGGHEGSLYLVRPWIETRSLAQYLGDELLPVNQAVQWGRQAARAVQHG